MSNVSNNGSWLSSIDTSEEASIWIWKNSSGGSIESCSKFSLGGSNFSSIFHCYRKGKVENRGSKRFSSNGGRGNWEVGSSNSESVDRVSNVIDSLEKSICINILV